MASKEIIIFGCCENPEDHDAEGHSFEIVRVLQIGRTQESLIEWEVADIEDVFNLERPKNVLDLPVKRIPETRYVSETALQKQIQ